MGAELLVLGGRAGRGSWEGAAGLYSAASDLSDLSDLSDSSDKTGAVRLVRESPDLPAVHPLRVLAP